jgi:cellulose synthase/poly-beta-1,6-N-acetylglucosamine synthase-like glycosyltransferase
MFGEGIMYGLLFFALYFEVFLLVTFLQKRFTRIQPLHIEEADLPRVAIVVPCFNEETGVQLTMNSLLSLDYPAHLLEVIAVDDGSTDKTFAALQEFATDSRVRIFQKANGGKHTAMNFALEQTDAAIIGCLDADSIVKSDALRKIVPIFANTRIAAVTPGIHVRAPETILQHMQNVEYQLSVFNRWIFAALGSVFITPGPFSFFRTSVLRELGGWREGHSTEDMELALRIQLAGHLIANAPKAVVHTSTPRTIRTLFHQRVRWTYGWLRNAMDYYYMIGNKRYGNLGLIVLPTAIISIFTGIYFFSRIVFFTVRGMAHAIEQYYYAGFQMPQVSFDLFYVNTSAVWFLVWVSVALILVLISMGSLIGTGRRTPPASTPIFLLFYSFLVPLWLGTAVVRAVFRTGVRWR